MAFPLGSTVYFADFVLADNVIVEVKGMPRAWERWRAKTLPAICRYMESNWRVYVLGRCVNKEKFSSLDDFLGTMIQAFPVEATE